MQLSQKVFTIVVCSIHTIYFFGSLYLGTYMNNDSPEYITQAYNLVHHGSFYAANWEIWPHLPEYYTIRPPLYSILILVTMYITNNPFVLLAFQSFISIYVWLMLRKYALKFIPSIDEKRLHIFLILALVFNPVQLILCNSIFSEILFQLLLCIAFFSFLNFLKGKQTKNFLIYILFLALALLTKPVLVFFAYANILLAVYVYIRIQRKWQIISSAFILPMVIFIVSTINEKNTGYYHYSMSRVYNLWEYNTPIFLNMKYGNDSGYIYKKEIYRLSMCLPDFKHQYGFIDSACTHILSQNIKSYIPYHAEGSFNFFIAPGREFINDYLGRKDVVPKNFMKELNIKGWKGVKEYLSSQNIFLLFLNVGVTIWNILLLLGLFVFTFSKRIPVNIKILALLLLYYFAGVSSLALGTARYKAAIYPILLFCNSWIMVTGKFSILKFNSNQ